MPRFDLDVGIESWPLARAFVISRGAKTEARVVVAHVRDGAMSGRGEATPYSRYGETPEGVARAIREASGAESRASLARLLPPGAARNALDCAFWDLEAKRAGMSAAALAGVPLPLARLRTAYTLSLDTPEAMAAHARAVPRLGLLKLKLGGAGDAERLRAVRQARPGARLLADANEAWTPDMLAPMLAVAREAKIEVVEQPLPAGADGALRGVARLVPVCADESVHSAADLADLRDRYDAVNIKLDKAGGLTPALLMAETARALGFKVMVGSMVATSLAMAPAFLAAQGADWVDLDSPLLLARDREHGLVIDAEGWISPPLPALWG